MSAVATRLADRRGKPSGDAATIGCDLLSLVSTAMYVEPLTIYREYVQNAADSIDEARERGLLGADGRGRIEIDVDPGSRSVRIRDDGTGIPASVFARRMRALGASGKRGTSARGFRGVGRLAGLAYAQRLVFRSRSQAGDPVMELSWDCRRLRAGMKDRLDDDLAAFVEEITDLAELDGEWPDRFFEVELAGVVRQGDDRLLRAESVRDYLSQVAPVPFDPAFSHASELGALLEPWLGGSRLDVVVDGGEPLTRPHRDANEGGAKSPVILRELTTFEIPGMDGGVAAVGWIAHHDYDGAVPTATMIKGLRARVGDVQIGGSSLLQDVFPEPRFCSWTVGEVHVLDRRIIPNGRRDNFEQNGHFSNLMNHLAPIGRDVARRCRVSSAERQRRRNFETQAAGVEQQLDVLGQGALGAAAAADLSRSVQGSLLRMERLVGPGDLLERERDRMQAVVDRQRARLAEVEPAAEAASPLDRVPEGKRETYREVIDLIYQCSSDRAAAKSLVDRILERVGSG